MCQTTRAALVQRNFETVCSQSAVESICVFDQVLGEHIRDWVPIMVLALSEGAFRCYCFGSLVVVLAVLLLLL